MLSRHVCAPAARSLLLASLPRPACSALAPAASTARALLHHSALSAGVPAPKGARAPATRPSPPAAPDVSAPLQSRLRTSSGPFVSPLATFSRFGPSLLSCPLLPLSAVSSVTKSAPFSAPAAAQVRTITTRGFLKRYRPGALRLKRKAKHRNARMRACRMDKSSPHRGQRNW